MDGLGHPIVDCSTLLQMFCLLGPGDYPNFIDSFIRDAKRTWCSSTHQCITSHQRSPDIPRSVTTVVQFIRFHVSRESN